MHKQENSFLPTGAAVSICKIQFNTGDTQPLREVFHREDVLQAAFKRLQNCRVMAHHWTFCGFRDRLPRARAKRPVYLFQLNLWSSKYKGFAMLYFTRLLMAGRREVLLLLLPRFFSSKSAAATFRSESPQIQHPQSFFSIYYVCFGAL